MISLLTCTGDRQELFARCERWMVRQTIRDWEWIVVDDGREPTEPDAGQQYYIKRRPTEAGPHESFKGNLRAGLEACDGEFIFIIEDDDWYHPAHIERLLVPLMEFDLVGESHAKYYHVGQRKFRQLHNANHASLCQTAFHRSLIPTVLRHLDTAFVDLKLWANTASRFLHPESITCVGLKGQVGRMGIGIGHRPRGPRWCDDLDGSVLREWIGEDTVEVLKDGTRTDDSPRSTERDRT